MTTPDSPEPSRDLAPQPPPVPLGEEPVAADPQPDPQRLIEDLARYESLDELDAEQFEQYARAETALEMMLMARSDALSVNCEYDEATEMVDHVIELNQTMRRIAERERSRVADSDPAAAADIAIWRDLADGLLLLLDGQKLSIAAETRRLAGDLDGAIDCLEQAAGHFARLAKSDLPQAWMGEMRSRTTAANATLFSSLQEIRIGNYRGALDQLSAVRVQYDELLQDTEEIEQPPEHFRPILAELIRSLTSAVVEVDMLSAVNDMLLSAQDGKFVDVVDAGRIAAQGYETSILALRSAGSNRNAIALRQMELEYVQGWVHLATAEAEMDRADWDRALTSIRTARRHWKAMSVLGLRSIYAGVMAQRPDNASHEFLLRNAERRLERDRHFRNEIGELRESVRRTQLHNIQVINSANAAAEAQRGSRMSGDTNNFAAPVNVGGVLGSGGHVNVVQQAQQQAPPQPVPSQQVPPQPVPPRQAWSGTIPQPSNVDRHQLARELTALAEVLSAGPRSTRERHSVELVRQASEAAQRGDHAGVNNHLAGTAPWVLGVAVMIGTELAAAALRQSTGA